MPKQGSVLLWHKDAFVVSQQVVSGHDNSHLTGLCRMVASILIASSVDPVTTAGELGHADANTTNSIYAH